MTGLDRLRELADAVTGSVWANTSSIYCKKYGLSIDNTGGSLSDFLRQIADQIEDEQEERITRRAEDREAAEWVREHGGLDAVKERTMPEDMSWPFYEDGEPVRLGEHWQQDEYDWSITSIDSIEFAEDGVRFENEYADAFYRYGERVKRPAPPVLAADGEPLEAGQTVYHIADGKEYTVEELFEDGAMVTPDGITGGRCRAGYLTHERPDSWERLEEDCAKSDVDYCAERGLLDPSCDTVEGDASTRHCTDCGCTCGEKMARDLVRRCRALAERERGE